MKLYVIDIQENEISSVVTVTLLIRLCFNI